MDLLFINILVLSVLFLKLTLELYLEYLNRRSLRVSEGRPPEQFSDMVSEEDFKKSVRYSLAKSVPNFLELIIDAGMVVGVLYSGVAPWFYDLMSGELEFLPGFWADSLFVFSFFFLVRLIVLPLEWYRIFSIETRFGFNTMTPGLWGIDFLKQTLISAVLTLPILSGLFYLVRVAGDLWWLWGWAAVTVFQWVMFMVYPKWIMPWFNKFTALPEGELREVIMALSQRLGFRAQEIMVMDGSRRSKHSNAFFTGMGKGRRVVFFDTLVEQLNTKEMEAVFAHEVGHYKKKHTLKRMAVMMIEMLVFFFLADQFKNFLGFNENFGLVSGNLAHTLILLVYLGGMFTFWLHPIMNLVSRSHEYQADDFARRALGEGASLISGLKKLYKENLGNLIPHPWYSFFYYSHPVLGERIRALSQGL